MLGPLSMATSLVPAFFTVLRLSLCRGNWRAVSCAAHRKQGAKCHLAKQGPLKGSAGCKATPPCRDWLGQGVMGILQSIICEGQSAPGTSPWEAVLQGCGSRGVSVVQEFFN